MEQTQQQIIEYYNTFYDAEGFTYYPPEFTRAVLKTLCAKAGVAPGARVLDVGCATGYYSAILTSLGYEVTGIDISETGILKAREQYPDIRFEVQDATALPYPAGSFDFVFALGVSVANTRDLGEMHAWLTHMLGVLSPEGTLAMLGGSDLSGETSKTSDWFNHTWTEIQRFVPPGAVRVQGPWLTHFRLMKTLPPSLSMNRWMTTLLWLLPLRFQRRIVLLFKVGD
ncbi:MAG: class I SAM-dependent methyltransferase [Bacteroidota bacterium]|jgi:ubiquinone/menaquinone biosynthesis C-methylase UbiE